jgi:methylphosphotriester-DNA--protein-cysteine methyltransferase
LTTVSAKLVRVKPGEMTVTRSFSDSNRHFKRIVGLTPGQYARFSRVRRW